jgi:hypothetical protein
LRYLTDLTFLNNSVVGSNGNDIADSSNNAFDYYTLDSVTGCTSSSLLTRFYLINRTTIIDCILLSFSFFFFFSNYLFFVSR